VAELTEALPQLVWGAAPDGGCDYFSTQWTTYTGISESGLLWLGVDGRVASGRSRAYPAILDRICGRAPAL